MKIKAAAVLLAIAVALALAIGYRSSRQSSRPETSFAEAGSEVSGPTNAAEGEKVSHSAIPVTSAPELSKPTTVSTAPAPTGLFLAVPTNKLERLAQIREFFNKAAAGDHVDAMRATKAITNATERETALLTLVTEWTGGNLRNPRLRAGAISEFGLEAGLGLELASDPDLALQWAQELTGGAGRQAVITQAATALLSSDPARAFSLSDAIPEEGRETFLKDLYARWGSIDTDAALTWAGQLPAAADRAAAAAAIRTSAPVGIGAAIMMQDGYPAIGGLVKGGPAELSGQLHQGDRILALAQGDSAFIDARDIKLAEIVKMIRGDAGTTLQLQVLASDAPAGAAPRTVSITRDQVKFKTN
jgi:hypothetical protein